MRTDSIFYKIFETLPDTLFALIGEPLDLAKDYEFKSIEVKELAFRIDGVGRWTKLITQINSGND